MEFSPNAFYDFLLKWGIESYEWSSRKRNKLTEVRVGLPLPLDLSILIKIADYLAQNTPPNWQFFIGNNRGIAQEKAE